MISKNRKVSELDADPLHGLTAVELLRMSGPKMRDLIYGKDGKVPRQGILEAIEALISEWKKS